MVANNSDIEKRLWKAADELRANTKLKSSDYSVPVLGLIFLRYADLKFADAQPTDSKSGKKHLQAGKCILFDVSRLIELVAGGYDALRNIFHVFGIFE